MTGIEKKRALPIGCAEWNRDRFGESLTFGSLALDISQDAPEVLPNPSLDKARDFRIIHGGSHFNDYPVRQNFPELRSPNVDTRRVEYREVNGARPRIGVQTTWIRNSAFFRSAAVLVAIGVFLVVFNPFARLDPSALPPNVSPSHPLVITVQPGDTLWSIAQRVEPGKDPRPLVDLLNSATGGKPIDPGQQIVLK